jgi:hypothetical protein
MRWRSERRRERELAEALAASLDALRAGSASLEECLRRYPRLAEELEPLLRTAATVQLLGRVAPRDEARIAGRAAFLRAAARKAEPVPAAPVPLMRRRPWVAFAPVGIAAALFAAIAIPVLGSMDTGSTPGDWNYGFKRATERIRLALTTDPSDRRLLRLEFASRRLDEIERLKATGHVASQKADVAALIHDVQTDVSQATASAQSAGALPSSQKDQFDSVTNKANQVLSQVQESVPQNDPVNAAAQGAREEINTAAKVVSAVPTTTPPKSGTNQPISVSTPSPSGTNSTPTVVPPTVVTTPPPTTPPTSPAETVTPSAPGTPAGSPTVGATGTPPATGTASSTATVISATATPPPTPSAVPTRVAPVVPAVVNTPAPVVIGTPAAAPPMRTPAATPPAPVATGTPASEPPALAANPTRTPLPAALAPLGGSASPGPNAEPTPARTATPPAAPTPVGTRASTVLPPVTGSTVLVAGANVFKYAGAPASLDQITASLGGQLVVVWYVNALQTSSSWYPGTPAPTIEPGAILTIVTRGPAVLAAPGTLLSAGR